MENEKVTAEWARKTAETQIGVVIQKQIETALANIETAVKGNKMSASVSCSLDELAQVELRRRGFKVVYNDGDPRDQRESGYYTISW